MSKIVSAGIISGVILWMVGCSSAGTEITGSWKNPVVTAKKIDRILVTALTDNTTARQTVENDLAAKFAGNGIGTVKSIEILPPRFTEGEKPDKETLLKEVEGTGVDAILTVALLDKESETRYIPGSYGYYPVPRFGYYGRFWGYFYTWYPTLLSPGYYAEDRVYFLETNLYDARTEELLWSAQSETYNPRSLSEFSKEYATIVLSKLEKDGLIKT